MGRSQTPIKGARESMQCVHVYGDHDKSNGFSDQKTFMFTQHECQIKSPSLRTEWVLLLERFLPIRHDDDTMSAVLGQGEQL